MFINVLPVMVYAHSPEIIRSDDVSSCVILQLEALCMQLLLFTFVTDMSTN